MTDKKKGKKKKKGLLMTRKGFLVFINVIMALAVIVLAADLYFLGSVDKRFIRAADAGLCSGWAEEGSEEALRDRKSKGSTDFINAEYEAVKIFRDKKFRSSKLGEAAGEYIAALEDCHKVVEKHDINKDFNGFWKEFSEPYARRVKAFYKLYNGDFGLLSTREEEAKKYKEEREELLLQGWALGKTAEIEFKRDKDKEGTPELTAKVKNDSGHELEYIDLSVDLYDKDGNHLEMVSAYAADIKKDAEFELQCFESEPGKAAEFVITAINCKSLD